MGKEWSSRPVLVGVESPDVLQQLARTAGDLALLGAGTVRLGTVTVKPHDLPFGVFADETFIGEYAAESHAFLDRATTPAGVTVERDVIAAQSAARGLLAAVEETDPAALLIGWQGRSGRSDAVLGTIVERVPCDLYVERVGRELAGSVPRRVIERTDRTVILARDGEMVSETLRRLLGSLRL